MALDILNIFLGVYLSWRISPGLLLDYTCLNLAPLEDSDSVNDPTTWGVQIQTVPTLMLNKDQHYVANPNAKPWDTTSMVHAIYVADYTGKRLAREEMVQLPKTDVQIIYTFQAPSSPDKVDLTKAGIYTVTFSHTYSDGHVVKDSRKVYVDPVSETETKRITRTINYVEEGNESHVLHDPTIQIITFTRIKTIDIKTGTTSYTDWTAKDDDSFAEVTSPTINGYTTTKDKVAAQAVTVDSENLVVNITYKKNPAPVNPEQPGSPSNPDNSGATTPQPGKPTDPTKPSEPTKPGKPGKPSKPGQPTKPDQDTITEETDYLKVKDPKENEHETSKDKTSTNHEKVKLEKKQKGTGFVKGANDQVAKDKANVAQDTTNQIPQTGESKNNLAVMGLALIGSSLVALAGLLFNRKKD